MSIVNLPTLTNTSLSILTTLFAIKRLWPKLFSGGLTVDANSMLIYSIPFESYGRAHQKRHRRLGKNFHFELTRLKNKDQKRKEEMFRPLNFTSAQLNVVLVLHLIQLAYLYYAIILFVQENPSNNQKVMKRRVELNS